MEDYHNKILFDIITGAAFEVYNEYHEGLLESAYEAALKYLLQQKGIKVEQQVLLPMFFKDVKLEQHYRMDLVVNDNTIVELKAMKYIDEPERRQLKHYMHLTHQPYGIIINFSPELVYTERWGYDTGTHKCFRII